MSLMVNICLYDPIGIRREDKIGIIFNNITLLPWKFAMAFLLHSRLSEVALNFPGGERKSPLKEGRKKPWEKK
jgi:hypothetical protein